MMCGREHRHFSTRSCTRMENHPGDHWSDYKHGDETRRLRWDQNGKPVRRIEPGDGDRRHGTANGYKNLGCRCDPCTEGWREVHQGYMERHPEQVERHRARQIMYRQRNKGA